MKTFALEEILHGHDRTVFAVAANWMKYTSRSVDRRSAQLFVSSVFRKSLPLSMNRWKSVLLLLSIVAIRVKKRREDIAI